VVPLTGANVGREELLEGGRERPAVVDPVANRVLSTGEGACVIALTGLDDGPTGPTSIDNAPVEFTSIDNAPEEWRARFADLLLVNTCC
jgi:hypothetical protein